MSQEQGQPIAQGSHSADCQVSNQQPIIDPLQTLAKYRISCSVNSVYYYADGNDNCCAVLLEVGFRLDLGLGERLVCATFPTRVPDIVLKLKWFPKDDDPVKMSEYSVKRDNILSPSFQSPVGGGSLGSRSVGTDKMEYEWLLLQQQKGGVGETLWKFTNNKSNFFPSSVKLLLVVRSNRRPQFSFTLEILPTLEVHANLKKKWWHPMPTTSTLRPPPRGDGWSCQIENDYDPEEAMAFLREPQLVGMRAAMLPYLKEFRQPT